MTKKQFKSRVQKCPICRKKPEGFNLYAYINDDFAERLSNFDRTTNIYTISCEECSIESKPALDENTALCNWNEQIIINSESVLKKSA